MAPAMDRLRKLSAILDDDAPDDAAMEALLGQSSPSPKDPASAEASGDAAAATLDASAVLPRTPAGDFACVECIIHAAELFCEQCHDYFCELCFRPAPQRHAPLAHEPARRHGGGGGQGRRPGRDPNTGEMLDE
jgi:hypothetical protein